MTIRRRLFTELEAADLVGVKPATIRKWKQRGKLATFGDTGMYLDSDVYEAASEKKSKGVALSGLPASAAVSQS